MARIERRPAYGAVSGIGASAWACLLAAGAWALAAPTVARADGAGPPAVQFGPIRFGMGPAEIQAALPAATWETKSKSEFTGRPFRVAARDALDYGGWRMNVDVRDEKYDRHVELTSRKAVADAVACEREALTLFTALESSAGALQAARDPNGESVPFGVSSTALFNGYDARSNRLPRKALGRGKVARMAFSTKREARQLEVKGLVTFDAANADNCSASVIAIGWRERPPLEVMAYDEKKVVGRMSIGDRHRLASTLNFTSDAVVVPQQCEVSRQSGRVLTCHAAGDPALDPAIVNVAGRYAGAMKFDTSGLDRDDPQTVLVEIPVRVARSDVRPVELPKSLLPMAMVQFEAEPTPRDLNDAFPWQALRAGVGAEVNVGCWIQEDGSLICFTLDVRPQSGGEPFRAEFERAVDKVVPLYRVAPKLRDGRPSAGAALGMGVTFKVSD